MGTVFNIQRYCLNDGDGIRTTVFFKGCPLRCIWCHNPEGLSQDVSLSFSRSRCTLCASCLRNCSARSIASGNLLLSRDKCIKCGECVLRCPNGANELIGMEMSAEEVFEIVKRDKIYYKTSGGGMTLSGGEPSMQADFALELVQMAHNEGISTYIETCGIGKHAFYRSAAELSASFLFDIKCIDTKKHKELTGVSNEKIFENLQFLLEYGADVIIRLPLIPDVNDSDGDIGELCSYLKRIGERCRYIEVMPYHALGTGKSANLGYDGYYSANNARSADKERWKKLFCSYGVSVRIPE